MSETKQNQSFEFTYEEAFRESGAENESHVLELVLH